MPETEPNRGALSWKRLTNSISAKLIGSLLAVMVVIFGLLGYLNIRLHRQRLEAATLASAERVSDVIRRTTTYYMMRNDREGLYHAIQTMADAGGMVKVRIFDREGRISYSTDPAEVSHVRDKTAEACYSCHTQAQPLARLNRPDRFRIYRAGGQRVLGIITPLENQPSCSNADCHAHPASQQVLGVLDTNLSLASADAQLKVSSARMLAYTAGALLMVAVLSWVFVWRVVGKPIKALKNGTEHLSQGELGYQIEARSQHEDEVGDLARSFNDMSLQLRAANARSVSTSSGDPPSSTTPPTIRFIMRPAIRSLRYTCPRRTFRMADNTLTVASSLVIYPSAPARNDRSAYSISSCMDNTSTGSFGHISLRLLINSNPLDRFSEISRITRSGTCRLMSDRAVGASAAAPHT